MDDDLRAYSVKEAAELLGVSVPYLRIMIGRGDIRVKRVGRRVLVPAAAIREFLAPPERPLSARVEVRSTIPPTPVRGAFDITDFRTCEVPCEGFTRATGSCPLLP